MGSPVASVSGPGLGPALAAVSGKAHPLVAGALREHAVVPSDHRHDAAVGELEQRVLVQAARGALLVDRHRGAHAPRPPGRPHPGPFPLRDDRERLVHRSPAALVVHGLPILPQDLPQRRHQKSPASGLDREGEAHAKGAARREVQGLQVRPPATFRVVGPDHDRVQGIHVEPVPGVERSVDHHDEPARLLVEDGAGLGEAHPPLGDHAAREEGFRLGPALAVVLARGHDVVVVAVGEVLPPPAVQQARRARAEVGHEARDHRALLPVGNQELLCEQSHGLTASGARSPAPWCPSAAPP